MVRAADFGLGKLKASRDLAVGTSGGSTKARTIRDCGGRPSRFMIYHFFLGSLGACLWPGELTIDDCFARQSRERLESEQDLSYTL